MRIHLIEVMDAELNSSSLAKKFKMYFNKLVVSCRCYGLCPPCEAQRLTLIVSLKRRPYVWEKVLCFPWMTLRSLSKGRFERLINRRRVLFPFEIP